MRGIVKPSWLWKLAGSGALLGVIGFLNTDPASGKDARRAPSTFEQQVFRDDAEGQEEAVPIKRLSQQVTPPVATEKIPAEGEPGTKEPQPPTPQAAAEEEKKDEEEEKAWSLNDLFTNCCGTNWLNDNQFRLGGNTVQSFTFNFQGPQDKFNGPVTWTDRSNEYQLNQQWLYFERSTDTSKGCDWDVGGRADFLFGSSARLTTEAGLEDHINSTHAFYGVALPQFYAEVAYKKLKVKAGHWISPVGYFTVDTTQNFFNTIPYTYQYGEPFTHTGVLATWTATDQLVVGGGFTRGWDNFGNFNPNLGYIGTATYTFCDKSTLAYVHMYSNEPTQTTAVDKTFSGRYFQTLVYSRSLSEKWNYVAQSDFGHQGNALLNAGNGGQGTGGTAMWYGLNQYVYYTCNDKWTWGANFEWFRDEEGYRVGGFLPNLPNAAFGSPNAYSAGNTNVRGLSTLRNGYAGNFFQMTVGPRITFNKNVFLRPNLRLDWFSGTINPATNPGVDAGGGKPYNNGKSDYQGILGTDLVIVY